MNDNKTNDSLEEILKWLKLIGSEYLKKKIKDGNLFKDKKEILAYHYSDGTKSSREISKITKLGHMKITLLWKQWIQAGIAEPSKKYKGGRCKKNFELSEFGISKPKVK